MSPQGEVKGLNTRVKEFDLEGSVYDWTFLPDELIEPGLPNFTGAVRGSVNSAIFPGSGAVQGHLKANGLSVLRRTLTQNAGHGCGAGTLSCRALAATRRSRH
jgi:hypothetical protein